LYKGGIFTDEHEQELRKFLRDPNFFKDKTNSSSEQSHPLITDMTLDDYELEWQFVNHSILILGWGFDKEKQIKYWICRNSYGRGFGEEDGHFRVRRGKNDFGIESSAYSNIPKPLFNSDD
jgi:C1A family cysteine protease